MSDQDQRMERNDERVEDLEVRDDEAREIGGGKKANPRGNPRWNRMKNAVGLGNRRGGSADA
jgi:hypothetical protein